MNDLAPVLQRFFTDKLMLQRQASPHTVIAYRDTFKLLLGFVQQSTGRHPARMGLADLDAATISKFLEYLQTDRGNDIDPQHASRGDPFVLRIRGPPHPRARRTDPAGVGDPTQTC